MQAALAAFVAFLAAVIPLALGVTKVVDTVRNLIDAGGRLPKVVWNVLALGAGVGLAVGWEFNFVAPLVQIVPALHASTRLSGVAGQLLTGIAIGGAAGFWHEKLDQLSSMAKRNVPTPVA